MNKITIYTDGACSGNPGKGGWGAVLIQNKEERYLSGSNQFTTNNQMELTATIEALKSIVKPSNITLYTDSQYVKNGITSLALGRLSSVSPGNICFFKQKRTNSLILESLTRSNKSGSIPAETLLIIVATSEHSEYGISLDIICNMTKQKA